jgi:hypothetical protein
MARNSTTFKKGHKNLYMGGKKLNFHGNSGSFTSEKLKGNKFAKGNKSNKTSFKKGNIPWNTGRGIIGSENELQRKRIEYKFWRKMCFLRDNFTDQITGQIGGKLVVHHINNFADFPELRTSLENGVTLSEKTHKEFHKQYGKNNNTMEQLLTFKKNYNG